MGTLVLTRKAGERTVIKLPDGREVRVTVFRIGPNSVREAWEAPRDVTIVREEVLQRDEALDREEERLVSAG